MEQRLTIITLGVNDLKISENFYCNTLGWEKTGDYEEIIFIKMNGIMLGLYPKNKLKEDAQITADGGGFSTFTIAHNTHSIEEVDAIFADLTSKGVTIPKPPTKAFWGGYSGYFSDPDGYLWEVAFNPFMELSEEGNVI